MIRTCLRMVGMTLLAANGAACAQNCGSGCGGQGGYGSAGSTNCGREISQADAEALWAPYCTETCFDFSRHHGHSGRCKPGGNFGYGSCGAGKFGACGACGSAGCAGGCGGKAAGCTGKAGGCAGGDGHRLGHSGFGSGSGSGRGQGNRFSLLSSGSGNCFGYPAGGYGNCGSCGTSCSKGGDACGCDAGGHADGGGGRLFRHLGGHGHSGLFSKSASSCGSKGGYFEEGCSGGVTAGLQCDGAGCGTHFSRK
jgi:hypothetical protein